jgi:hypothetical protein
MTQLCRNDTEHDNEAFLLDGSLSGGLEGTRPPAGVSGLAPACETGNKCKVEG